MKSAVLIFSLFILQAQASFLDAFTGAMTSVETAFGKLLNDVVADVKNTVHCTILAMEQVLVISGAVNGPTSKSQDCYDDNDNSYPVFTEKDNNQGTYSEKDFAEQISSSISKVNETLTNILDNDRHERIRDIRKEFQNETDRLTEVSHLLRQELEKISKSIKTDYEYITSNTSSLESLWDNMKILHELEKHDENSSEVTEISQVLDEAIDILHVNTVNNITTDDDKIKVIIRELEHQSHSNNVTFNKIENELSEWNYRKPILHNFSSYDVTLPTTKRSKDKNATKLNDTTTSTEQEVKLPIEQSQIKDYVTTPSNTFLEDIGLTDSESTDLGPDFYNIDSSPVDIMDSVNSSLSDSDSLDSDPIDLESTDSTDTTDIDSTELGPTNTETIHSSPVDTDSANIDPTEKDLTKLEPTNAGSKDTDWTNSDALDSSVFEMSKEDRKNAIDDAKNIIDNSAKTDVMLEKLFTNEGHNHELLDFNSNK